MKTLVFIICLLCFAETSLAGWGFRSSQRFGNGSKITVKQNGHSTVTGQVRPFGTNTVIRWSTGQRTTIRPFGNRIISTGPQY